MSALMPGFRSPTIKDFFIISYISEVTCKEFVTRHSRENFCLKYKAYLDSTLNPLIAREWDAGVGLDCAQFPTYVYPENLKALIRYVFPEGICNYPDPTHEKVVRVTVEDLFLVKPEKHPPAL